MARRADRDLFVGTVRRARSTLLRETALQAATAIVFAAHASAQPAPTARPSGGQVVAGAAQIGQTTAQTTVNQASQRAAINWQSFDVGSQHTVRFEQPNAAAVTLNRVVGPDPSQIAGRITANGNIIITNPAGVAFSRGAQVDVNGLIVSAPGISTQNFMAGRLVFDQAPKPGATVSNAGSITVRQAGLAALVAPQVANSGVINARLGHVVLAGAEAHTIDLYGDGLVAIDVTKAVTQLPLGPGGKPATALVTNTGAVIADGGTVQITARAADGIVQDLVRAGGSIRANTVGARTGRIDIAGVGGSVRVEGRVVADGGAGSGGTIAVSASDAVTVASGATIRANGGAGGGTVALGTTIARARAGQQAALTPGASVSTPSGTARRVVVESGASVSADGRGAGHGGTVTALSTQSTEIDGMLTTRGGAQGGRGGVIEASSDLRLALPRAPDAGRGGTLYLDPYDLVIGTGTPQATLSGPPYGPGIPLDGSTSGTSYIAPATLQQAAQNGAVTISLNANHDLTVQQAVNLTAGQYSSGGASGGANLYLHAGHDLTVLANITIGASGSYKTLTLDAGHEIFIGPTGGSPAVTLAVDGNITMTTTGSFAADPLGSSITVHDNSIITTPSALSLEASNRIDIGSHVQISTGPGGGVAYNPQDTTYTGILLQAGSDITVANSSTLTATGNASGYTPAIIADAGGSVTVGTGNAISVVSGTIYMYAGSPTEAAQNANAPAANASGAISIGASAITGASQISLGSGQSGQTTLAAGSVVQASASGAISISSGSLGTVLAGTVDGGAGGSVQLNSGGAVQELATGALKASNLDGTASSYDLIGAGNQVATIGAAFGDGLSATAGDVRLVDSVPLTVGNGTGSTGGGIQVPNGGTITLIIDQLTIGPGALADPASEGYNFYSLYAPGGAAVIQPYTAGQAVELVNGANSANTLSVGQDELPNVSAGRLQLGSSQAGALTLRGTIDLGGASLAELDLVSGGQISQTVGGTIAVGTLAVNGASVDLGGGANQIGTLGPSSASAGSFSLDNGTTPLTVVGALTASTQISLTLDSLSLCSCARIAATTLLLTPYSPGRQAELVANAQTDDRLSIDQAMIGAISVQNLVLGGNAQGGVTIGNAGETIDLSNHAATLTLVGPGPVIEGSGAGLRVGTLVVTGLPGGSEPASIALGGTNHIGVLTAQSSGDITVSNAQTLRVDVASTPGDVTITTTAGDLYVARTSDTFDGTANGVSGATVALNANGNLLFEVGSHPENVIQATTGLSLNAGGAITEDSGAIVTPDLTGYAAGAALVGPGNRISTLSGFIVSGDFALADASPLSVGGVVSVGNGRTLSLASDNLQIGAASTLSAPGGLVALESLSAGDPLSVSDAAAATIVAGTLRLGSATTGDLAISGTFTLPDVGTLDLRSAGTLSEAPDAALQVGTLTGQANSASLPGSNAIDRLGGFAVAGASGVDAFSLSDANALTVSGGLTAGSGNVAVNSLHDLVVTNSGTITAPNGGITLDAPSLIEVDGALSAAHVTVGAGPGGIRIAADVTGSNGVDLVAGGAIRAGGPITQTAGAITTPLLSVRGTSVSLDGNNQIASLGSSTANTGDFGLATASALAFTAAVSVSTGHTIAIASNGAQFNGGGLTAPAGLIELTPFTAGGLYGLGGVVAPGGVTADTLQIGNGAAGPISLSGTLRFDQVGTLALVSAGAISQAGGGVLTAGTLTVQSGSASLGGSNTVAALGPFTVAGALSLNDTGSLVVAGAGSAGSLALSAGGSVQFTGTLGVIGVLNVDAAGPVTQGGGTLNAGALSGSARGSAQFGTAGSTRVTTLAGFDVAGGGTLSLLDAAPLIVTGPISAGTVTLSALGALTLQGGQFSADNVSLAVSQGAAGSAMLIQTGATSFVPLGNGGGTLLLALPGSGSVTLQGLNAASMSLGLNLGDGTATGTMTGAALHVFGQGGSASLTGTVADQTGAAAAAISTILPGVDPAYKLNSCTIGVASCGAVVVSNPGQPGSATVSQPGDATLITTTTTHINAGTVDLLTPKSFLDTELGNILNTDLLTVDLITIGIVRDPDATELLPNVSDRDY